MLQAYKYLGLYLDNKLTVKTQLKYIDRKVKFISYKFRPIIDTISPGYRKNLWSTFIKSHFELLAILHASEPALNNRTILERAFRKSFQSITKIGKTTPLSLQHALIGTNLSERGNFLWTLNNLRWECRRQREGFSVSSLTHEAKEDLLEFVPREFISLINLMNSLCPLCKVPLSSAHLLLKHSLYVPDIPELAKSINADARSLKRSFKMNKTPVSRLRLIERSSSKVIEIRQHILSFIRRQGNSLE